MIWAKRNYFVNAKIRYVIQYPFLTSCQNFPTYITAIQTQGDRIYVSDVQESIHFCKYKRNENQLYIFADEPVPRWLTSVSVLDYDTVAGADKFGNVFVSRLPGQVSDEIEDDPTGSKLKVDQGYLNGAPHKVEIIVIPLLKSYVA
jgi:splicing factor 3B subunit 3